MSQLQVTGEAKIRDIQGPVVANSGVVTALDGAASQYVRGDGTLADFPTSTGGGSSVSYYLNSSVSQGTIGGVAYRELSKEPIIGAGTDIAISANGYVANYLTDANDPDVLSIPGGNFNCEFYFSVNNNTGSPTTYAELYKYDGTTFTLLGSSVGVPESINQGTTIAPYYFAIPVATASLALTDRLAIRIYVNVDGRTVTLHTENGHLCQVVTTLSKGMVSLNNLTDQSQFLTTGTAGTNFAIASSGDTHTFNLPVASATNTGKLSSTDWSVFNNKQAALSFTAPLDNTSNTISIPAATSLVDGYLDNVDWTTFNNKQNQITLTTTGNTGNATFIGNTLNIPNYTPDLSGYVPYTGATANVNLGVFGLTAGNITFTGNGIIDSNLLLKTAGKITTLSTYNTIYGLSSGFGIGFADFFGNDTIFNFSVSGDFTYTFPSITGTLALLEGTQTFSGLKTFSSTLATNALIVSGQLTLFSNITNGSYTYTLPSATGTLALTSQIVTISGTPNVIPRFNSSGTNIESGSIQDFGTAIGTPPSGFITMNARLTVNNYAEVNRYLSIIQNVDSSWALPSTGTNLEAFITSVSGGLLISDTAYLRPRKASDDTFKRFVIQGDDLILNDTTRRTLINKAGSTQSTTKLEVAGYTRFDAAVNLNGVLQFNATDSTTPTYLSASSGNLTMLTTGQIVLGTNSVSKFVFDVNGALNLGTSDNSNIININNQFTTLNSTMQGVHITPSIVTASGSVLYTGVKSYPQFFLSTGGANAFITHFSAINASNTRDTITQIGLYIDNLTSTGLTYGIQSTLSSGTGKYNLYIDGTAINYLKGRLGVDQTNPQYAVDVTGDVNVTGNFKVNGTNLTQGISGGGTQNYIPRYTSGTTVGDSKIYQAPASNHVLVNTTFDYSASGGYLQVGGGFTTESFANIIYGSALFAGNSVYLKLVNGNTIQGTGDRTYFIENRVNAGATSANYYLNYWDGGTTNTRYSLDHTGLHTFNGQVSISGATSIGGTLTGAAATFSGNVGFGATTGISASVTIFNTSEANQLKLAGAAPAAVFTDSLTSATHVAAMGLVTASNNFIAGTVAGEFVFANQTNKGIIFGTGLSTTEKMRITSAGRLLLGTTTDNGSLLQVAGAATFTGALSGTSATFSSTMFVNSPLNNTVITTSDATNITNGFNLLGSSSYWGIRTATSGNFNIDVFGGGVPKNALSIAQSTGAATFSSSVVVGDSVSLQGELYWGGQSSGQKARAYTTGASGSATLNFAFWDGSAWGIQGTLTSAGVWNTTGGGTSDARTKDEIDYNFDNGIESILKLQPTKFKFKNALNKQRRGFIAQDVLTTIPDLVLGDGEKEDGTYGLDYDGILALAVKAIQELKAEIEELKNK